MKTRLPGFDPFQNGWDAYDAGGLAAVDQIEAPLIMYIAEPELADELAARYRSKGLEPTDLRFGVWPDASPVQKRGEDEPVGVHLNVFGARQVRYGAATVVERTALDALTWITEEHVGEILKPEHGVSVHRFGRIPTMHHHIVVREHRKDGTDNWLERQMVGLDTRREMRARIDFDLVSGRREQIEEHVGATLLRFAK